ncbi:hypothetical protein G6F40_013699 [Rhizopus arrhizus]|nr:hypothetical protein G6F40_013699 [Rhizopus arrhizus]
MVSLARPLLADPHWDNKARAGRAEAINTCIACNQACLDPVFENKLASCLVNPRAAHEPELVYRPTTATKKVAVVGAGPAGLACATVAAERGHQVTLFDAHEEIGGQFNVAKRIPGKEEFYETLRYFRHKLTETGLQLRRGTRADAAQLAGFDEVVLATGITVLQVAANPYVALLGDERHPVARIGLRIGVVVQQQTTPGRGHRRLRRPLRAQFIGQAQGIGQHDIHGLGRRIVGIPQAGDPVQCDLARIRDVDSGQVDPY